MSPRLACLFLLAACGPKPTEPVAPSPAPMPDVVPEAPAPAPEAEPVLRCGGIAGLRCPMGKACVDDPDDTCVPGRGADCIGRCVDADEAPSTDAPRKRRPVSTDPEKCKALRFTCEEGEHAYSDGSGCGCESGPPAEL